MKKRIISLLLSLVMVAGLLPVTAYADIPENMSTWGGRQITHVEFTAYYAPDPEQNSYEMSRNTLAVGKEVNPDQIQFVPTSLTWKQGANTGTVTAQTTGESHSWMAVVNGTCQSLKDTEGKLFPLYRRGTGSLYRRNGNWSSGAEKWDRVYKSDMPKYVSGDYRYRLYFEVLSDYLKKDAADVTTQYRIAPDVTVTVTWLNSGGKTENFTVHPGSGMGVCNYTDNSMFVSTAGFFSPVISVTGTASLKMGNGSAIPSGYVGEEIKSFSLVNLVSGGTAPYTFSKVSGPDGITVSSDGTVSGAPTAAWETEQTLKIKVTDKKGKTAEGQVTVNPVKAARTVIKTVELSGLYQPYGDDDPANNRASIVKVLDENNVPISDSSFYIAAIMSYWQEQTSSKHWDRLKGSFEAGKTYRYILQFRIDDDDACEEYRMADEMIVTAPGLSSEIFRLGDYYDEVGYQCRYVYSPSMTAGTATQLTGTVSYTGAARYGQTLTAQVSDLPGTVTAAMLHYQWQYKDGSSWTSISGATDAGYTATDTSMIGKDIRVMVTADGCLGAIYGAPVKVQKNWNMGIPEQPELSYSSDGSKLTITNYKEDQEYAWTTTASKDSTTGAAVWPTSSVETGKILSSATNDTTYYVYTRYRGTDTQDTGRIIRAAMYTVPFADGSTGEDGETPAAIYARDLVYSDYDSKTPTIYLKKGDSITVEYQLNPNNANSNLPQWKESYTAADGTSASVTVGSSEANKLTITASAATGTVYVNAYKDASAASPLKWYGSSPEGSTDGRQITVKIYDPDDLTTVPFPYLSVDLGEINLIEGDTYDVNTNMAEIRNALDIPSDVNKSGYNFSAYVVTGDATSADGLKPVGNPADSKGSIVHIDGNTITAKQAGSATVYVFALKDGDSTPVNVGSNGHFAYFTVNVSARPALDNFTVTPSEVTLRKGDTCQLKAVKTPSDATGDITWSSGNTDAVTVDNTGKVTAKGEGTAKVYATCNGIEVYSVVTVKAECTTHSYYYVSENSFGHKAVCGVCGHIDDDVKEHNLVWYEDKDASGAATGTMHSECLDCGYIGTSVAVPTAPAPDDDSKPNSKPNHSKPSGTSGSNSTDAAKSADTGDAGIALYAALSLMSMTGGAWLVGKKRRDRK